MVDGQVSVVIVLTVVYLLYSSNLSLNRGSQIQVPISATCRHVDVSLYSNTDSEAARWLFQIITNCLTCVRGGSGSASPVRARACTTPAGAIFGGHAGVL